jgi:hypothetical protein
MAAQRMNLIRNALVFGLFFTAIFIVGLFLGPSITKRFGTSLEPLRRPQIALPKELLPISLTSHFVRVRHAANLQPAADKDFLVSAWFRLRTLPREGERILLFRKFNGADPEPSGYGLALTRVNQVLRPAVYWQHRRGGKNWYLFSEVKLMPQSWFLVALSLRDQRFLGLHVATTYEGEKANVQLAGGYQIDPQQLPASASDLALGTFFTKGTTGSVGPIGIAAPSKLTGDVKGLVRDMARTPGQMPDSIQASDWVLWIEDQSGDQSAQQQKVVFHGLAKSARKQARQNSQKEHPEGRKHLSNKLTDK